MGALADLLSLSHLGRDVGRRLGPTWDALALSLFFDVVLFMMDLKCAPDAILLSLPGFRHYNESLHRKKQHIRGIRFRKR